MFHLRSFKIVAFIVLFSYQNQFCICGSDDFKSNVDSFIDAFENAFPTEDYYPTTDDLKTEHDELVETSVLEETTSHNEENIETYLENSDLELPGLTKETVDSLEPVQEPLAVTETVFQPGSDVHHELTEEVQTMAQRAVDSIGNQLRLINVTDAISMVTDKVQRSLSLLVARANCWEESCVVSCRVELISRDTGDEITWHNCLDSPAANEIIRDKRGAVGGFKQVADAEAKELADVAVQTLDSIDVDDTKRVVTQIIKAQKQLVNGIMYHLTLEVGSSDCKEDADVCKSQLTDHNICKILMQRLFSGDAPRNAQVIKSECTPVSKAKDSDRKRAKRHTGIDGAESNMITNEASSKPRKNVHIRMQGGKVKQDANSQEIREIAEFALASIDKSSNSLNKQKIIRIADVRSQVVAGIKYFLRLELAETNCRKGSNEEVCNAVNENPVQSCNVVVWDKPWEKFRTITRVECAPLHQRKKRGALGSRKDADPNNHRVQEMAGFALSQLSTSDSGKLSVVVKKAQTQTVAGTNYYLNLQLIEAPNKVLKECDVVIYDKPWENIREMTSSNCKDISRRKRNAPGSRKDADPNNHSVQEMAGFALSQLSTSDSGKLSVVVKKAQTQTVAGTNYYLNLQLIEAPNKVVKECDVVIYDKPWENIREMTSSNCKDLRRRKRDVMTGGRNTLDTEDVTVQEVARFAVSELDAKSNSMNSQKLISVTKAESQLVSGVNYYLTLHLIETSCRKGLESSGTCQPAPNKVKQECEVVVHDKPWQNQRRMTSSNCQPAKKVTKRDVLVGGHTAQDKNNEDIQEAAQFAVEDLNKKSNSMYRQTLVEVLSAHTQVVAGMNYHLKLRVAESSCRKSNSLKSADCPQRESTVHQICDVTVWSQPWLKKREVTKSNCQPENVNVAGGLKSLDPKLPEVEEAAKLSLKSIDAGSNSLYKHALVKVIDAKVQTVAGKKYILTVEVGESECTKNHEEENCALRLENSLHDKCNVVVWDRPWLNKKEVLDVKCGHRNKRSIIVTKPNDDGLEDVHRRMFNEFKSKYNKVYLSEEEHNRRFRIFRANLKKIQTLQDSDQGTAIYGANMFADLSEKEFKKKYLGLKSGPIPKPSNHHMVQATILDVALPTDFDWRDHDAVTPVKNQGQCGSCWAFSVTGNVEGQWFLKHGNLLSLSEQELVDCDKTDNGCEGGYMTQAYEAIERIGGLETESDYPYDAEDETCRFNASEAKVQVISSVNITTNETQIAQWLFKNGPISIGINANAMQFYMGGVSHPFKFLCNKNDLDHGVLLVGFGVHRTSIRHKLLPYWLIKNSWGPHWGEKGYYRVYRGDGTCGVNQMASSAVVG